ncbi:MAG TPA: hypothetical protein VGO93_25725 [Candidatus Xenobia bacterium]|jgi:hypothetical protein
MVFSSDMVNRRQDAGFARELSKAARDTVQNALNAGLSPSTADALDQLADVFHATQQASRDQNKAILNDALTAINRDPQATRQYAGPFEEVKDQDMLVYPHGYHPVVHADKPVGQVILHHSGEAAYFDPKSLPRSPGVDRLEWFLHSAADAARNGQTDSAMILATRAQQDLGRLVSKDTHPVPIMVGHTVREEQRFKQIKLVAGGRFDPHGALSAPVPVVFIQDEDGQQALSYREQPRCSIAEMQNLPPHLDLGE